MTTASASDRATASPATICFAPQQSAVSIEILSRQVFLAVLLALALLAGGLVAYTTRDGVGLSLDSDAYLTAARLLLRGQGFSQETTEAVLPLTHFPPLYSVLLAAIGSLVVDGLVAARILNIALIAGSVVMVGLILRRAIGVSRVASLVGAAAMALSVHLVFAHAMAWTEGLFIFLTLVTLWLLGRFIDRPHRGLLMLAAAVAAAALLTRYAGAALVLACGAALLLCGRRRWKPRIIDLAVFGSLSCLPMVAWIVRNILATGTAANRQIAWHPPDGELLELGARTLAQWLWWTPGNPAMWSGFGVVVVVSAIAALSARNARAEGRRGRSAGGQAGGAGPVIACFAVLYVLFILTSLTFFDAHSPLDERILSPLFVTALICVVAELSRARPAPATGLLARKWSTVLAGLAIVYLGGQAYRVAIWSNQAPQMHLGYGMSVWRESDLIAFVRTIPSDLPIYSNGRAVIHLHTGRVVKPVPGKVDLSTRKQHDNIAPRLKAIERDLLVNEGYLIYFRSIRHRTLFQEEELRALLNLRHVYAGQDGNVYRWKLDKTVKRKEAAQKASKKIIRTKKAKRKPALYR
jgi:hypothetical protein